MRYLVFVLAVVGVLIGPSAAAAWTWPIGGPVLRPYSLGPDAYAAGQHRGVDVQGDTGEAVLAPASGVVSFAGTVPTHGRTVTIQTVAGYAVSLTHLGAVAVVRGDAIAEGTTLGVAGASGEPEWPSAYVHLGIRVGSAADDYVDPMTLLPPRAVLAPPLPEPAPAPVVVTASAAAPAPASASTPPAAAPAAMPAVPGGEPAVPTAIPFPAAGPAQPAVSEPSVTETSPARAPVVGLASAAATPTSTVVVTGSGGSSITSQGNVARPVEVVRQARVARTEGDVALLKGDRAGARPAAEGASPGPDSPTPAATLSQDRIGGAATAPASHRSRGGTRVDRATTTGRDRLPIGRKGQVPVSGAAEMPARSASAVGDRSAARLTLAGEPVLARILPVVLCALAALGAAAHVRRRSQRTLLV